MTGQSFILRSEAVKATAASFIGKIKVDAEHPLEVVIQRHRKKRSLSANALYWVWLGIISAETGNDPDSLHEWAKRQFSLPREVNIMGDTCQVYTTAKMSVADMSAYMERVEAWAAGEGIILPHPEDARFGDAA